jgi:hypothetical protein
VQDDNSIGTFATHLATQLNPLTAITAAGRALIPEAVARVALGADDSTAKQFGPLNAAGNILSAQGALFDKAKASFHSGDYGTAARHFASYLIPMLGPAIDKSSDEFQQGNYAAGAGDAVGIGGAIVAPTVLGQAAKAATSAGNATARAAAKSAAEASNAFAESHGIPLDAATKLDSNALRALQKQVGHTWAGEAVADRFAQGQQAAMKRVAGELADVAQRSPAAPETAGQAVRDALGSKSRTLKAAANTEYDRLRAMENDPSNQIAVALPKQAVDQIPDHIAGQLRRMVHELDASGYTKGKLVVDDLTHGDTHYSRGSGGAAVFDDITAGLGYNPTRAAIQEELEQYLAGGKETAVVKSALGVAKERAAQRVGSRSAVSVPELPPTEMQTPTRLEVGRVTSRDMGLPVDMTAAKEALRPLYEEMQRSMPVTQAQANPGLKALGNILDGPDMAPLSQVDRDLSAIKRLARERGGLAKVGVQHLEDAVQAAVRNGGDEAVSALQNGREAVRARVDVQGTAKALKGTSGAVEEPVAVYKQLTKPHDSSLRLLQRVQQQAPESVPQIARAYLDDLFTRATAKTGAVAGDALLADWNRLGPATKKMLFPNPGHVRSIDNFVRLAKRVSVNPNPSGTAHSMAAGGQLLMLGNPLLAVKVQLGSYGMSQLLYSQKGVAALTRLLEAAPTVPGRVARVPASMGRPAALANVLKVARDAGVQVRPAAADSSDPEQTQK